MTLASPMVRSGSAAPSPAPDAPRVFLFYYMVHLFLVMIPTSVFLLFFLVIAPRFSGIFKDFRTTLPAFTEWTMSFAALMTSGAWIPFTLLALAFPLLPAWLASRQRNRVSRALWAFFIFNVMFLLTMLGTGVAVVALFLPLMKLVQSVSGGDPGASN